MDSVTHETISMLRGDSKISQLADEAKITTLELRRYEKDTLLNMDNKPVMQSYQEKWKEQLAVHSAGRSDGEHVEATLWNATQ